MVKPPKKKPPRASAVAIRVRHDERKLFQDCAGRLGITLSSWMRMTLLKAARWEESQAR